MLIFLVLMARGLLRLSAALGSDVVLGRAGDRQPVLGHSLDRDPICRSVVRGDYVVGDATLNRFFAFHVIALPLVLMGLVAAHIIALHEVGSNNPDGIEIKKQQGRATAFRSTAFPSTPITR